MTKKRQQIELVGDQKLIIERENKSDLIRLFSRENNVSFSLEVTDDGPILKFEGIGLVLQCNNSLTLDAETISIIGRKKVNISSGEDLKIEAAGLLESEALEQSISAKLGNVDVKATDDVTLKGERIKMNC